MHNYRVIVKELCFLTNHNHSNIMHLRTLQLHRDCDNMFFLLALFHNYSLHTWTSSYTLYIYILGLKRSLRMFQRFEACTSSGVNKIASKVCTFDYTHAHFNTFLKLKKMASSTGSSGSSSSSHDVSRKISDVWKYFTKTSDKKKAICSICHKELAYSGGTTNLRDHVSSKHPLQYFPAGNTATGGKTASLDGFVRPSKCSEARAKGITDRVSQMVVQDLRPIRLVECEGFWNLLSYLEPGYTLPSRKQFSSDIIYKFETCKDKLKKRLEAEALSIALTTDICAAWPQRHI